MADEKIDGLVTVGVSAIPGVGIAQKVWSVVRPPNAQERFEQAKREYDDELAVRLVDAIRALQADVQDHGAQLDELAPLRALAVAEQVAKSAAEASGEPKVDAVLNAGARQFDPRMGPQEVRKYWLDRVTQLTDLEVRVLMLLKERAPLYYFPLAGQLFWGPSRAAAALPDEDRVALGSVLEDMHKAAELVASDGTNASFTDSTGSHLGSTTGRVLSPGGKMLVRFITPIGQE